MSARFVSRSRRHFLLAIGAGSAGAAGATMIATGSARTAEAPAASSAKRPGYRLTAHIGKYYRTTKI